MPRSTSGEVTALSRQLEEIETPTGYQINNIMKLYIAVLDEVPDHMVPVLVAHTVLGAHLHFYRSNGESLTPEYNIWLKDSFRKVVLKVNRKEFSKIKELRNTFLAHENSTLNGEKSCAVICPREEYPNVIKFAKMWQPTQN